MFSSNHAALWWEGILATCGSARRWTKWKLQFLIWRFVLEVSSPRLWNLWHSAATTLLFCKGFGIGDRANFLSGSVFVAAMGNVLLQSWCWVEHSAKCLPAKPHCLTTRHVFVRSQISLVKKSIGKHGRKQVTGKKEELAASQSVTWVAARELSRKLFGSCDGMCAVMWLL